MAISEQRDHQVRIESGELRAVIGDNDSDPPGAPWSHKGDPPLPAGLRHPPGHNGVWSLTSVHAPANLFTEPYAGLNYDFIFDGVAGRRAPPLLASRPAVDVAAHRQGRPATTAWSS